VCAMPGKSDDDIERPASCRHFLFMLVDDSLCAVTKCVYRNRSTGQRSSVQGVDEVPS
jgi:hypothetical protein